MNTRTKPTYKQQEFAREYVNNKGNGTQAALKVYDAYDSMTASAIAHENLKKPLVKQAIEVFKRETKELADEGLQEAIAQARREVSESTDPKVIAKARDFLLEAVRLFTSANSLPRNVTQNNKYILPKRD